MKNIVVVIVLVVIAGYFVPWKNINWGKFSLVPSETVTVVGSARSTLKNQLASFSAGIDVTNSNKDEAIKEVNGKIEAVIKSAKEYGIDGNDIKTQNLSIFQTEESYWDNGVQKSRKGQWRVSNSVEITLREIDRTAKLAEILTNSGANNVYGPNFRFDDTSEAEKTLFDKAMSDARERGELIAGAAGRKLGQVLVVNETGSSSGAYPLMKAEGMGGGGASVEPGSGTVSKSLTVTFELK